MPVCLVTMFLGEKKMKYEYSYRNTAGDFFFFNMTNIYSQWTALVNIIFTAAMVVLIANKWSESHIFFQGIMVVGLCLFPVIQPICIYLRSAKQAEGISFDTQMSFDDAGMHIRVQDHNQLIKWKDYKTTVNRPFVLVPIPDGEHAYILTERILKGQHRELYEFINGASSGAK